MDKTSNRRTRTALGLALATGLTVSVAASPAAAISHGEPSRPGPQQVLTRLAQQDVEAGVPGVIVRVDDGSGRVIRIARQAAWTRADHELTPDDEFRVGSNTKTMVATLILQEVAAGRLHLGDTIAKWLPAAIPNGHTITLRMLLNHTSGLADYLTDPAALAAVLGQDTRKWTPPELLAAGVGQDPLFAPGRGWSYSNTNYIALGLVLEKVTRTSLESLIDTRFAEPLHLRHTYLDTDESDRSPRLAHAYEPDAEHLAPLLPEGLPAGTAFAGTPRGDHVDTTWNNQSWSWAAGGVVSTAADWARFDAALLSGKLLPPKQMNQMRDTVDEHSEAPNAERYGLGLMKVKTVCGTVWGHTGGDPGYSSVNYADSTGRRSVQVLTTTLFGLHEAKAKAADQTLTDAAICTMLGRPVPATPAQ
jgi:D-alanyl-D-alanine carboxypeptidase